MTYGEFLDQYEPEIESRNFVKIYLEATAAGGKFSDYWKKLVEDLNKIKVNPLTGLTDVPDFFFMGTAITEMAIPESIVTIGQGSFYHCRDLKKLTISNGLRIIGKDAFGGCSSLINLIIPEGVKNIGAEAFRGCDSLVKIFIPQSVLGIGTRAFADIFPWGFSNPREVEVSYGGTKQQFRAIKKGKYIFKENLENNHIIHCKDGDLII